MVDVTVATSYIHMLLIIYTAYDQQHKKHLISDKITVIPQGTHTGPSGFVLFGMWPGATAVFCCSGLCGSAVFLD